MDTLAARRQMVDQQIRAWEVLDPRVLEALATVPREAFVPSELPRSCVRRHAHSHRLSGVHACAGASRPDTPGIGSDSSDTVLEVGTGTGYLSRVLHTARAVHALDRDSRRIHRDGRCEPARRCSRRRQSSRLATHSAGPLSVSTMSIAVTGSLPVYDTRFEQALRIGGRLFAVIGAAPVMDAVLVRRVDASEWIRESLFETVIDPLGQRHGGPGFVF